MRSIASLVVALLAAACEAPHVAEPESLRALSYGMERQAVLTALDIEPIRRVTCFLGEGACRTYACEAEDTHQEYVLSFLEGRLLRVAWDSGPAGVRRRHVP